MAVLRVERRAGVDAHPGFNETADIQRVPLLVGSIVGVLQASDELLRAWRNAQKMREFFLLADLRKDTLTEQPDLGALPAGPPSLQQQDSLYAGASDATVAAASAAIVRRVRCG